MSVAAFIFTITVAWLSLSWLVIGLLRFVVVLRQRMGSRV